MARATQENEQLDLDSMSDEELQALRERVDTMLDERVRNRFAEYQRIARGAGYEVTLTKIGEEHRRRRSRSPSREDRRSEISPKYRNPDNPSEIWSGRGREPKWMQREMASGKSRDDFLINRPHSG